MTVRITTAVLCLFAALSLQAQNLVMSELNNLSMLRADAKSRRVSSHVPSGHDYVRDILPGESRVVCDIKGTGIINHIWMTMSPSNFNRNNLVIKMYWDGCEQPSVLSPVGSFFGQGWDDHYQFNSLPLVAGPAESTSLVSYFSMPFAKGAKIVVENQDKETIKHFFYYVDYMELKKLPAGMGRFHAWYNHELVGPPQGQSESVDNEVLNHDGARDYLFADIKGRGHFVGVNYYIISPNPIWYGEGDDRFIIDGDEARSLLGTGTEDFFNTAWCPRERFDHPYFGCAKVNDQFGFMGRTHLYRYFIADPVLFDKSLRVSIEHGHGNNLTLDLSSVVYWYQSEAVGVPGIGSAEERIPQSKMYTGDVLRWREEWMKSKGNNNPAPLWGNEK